jgi:hypothetical protein
VATGLLAALAYLTRAEGAVLAAALLLVLAVWLVARRDGASAWRRFGAAVTVGLVVAAPYLGYLRWALGRWTASGRVQAAAAGITQPPSAVQSARTGGQVLDAFVWQGDPERFLRSLYELDAAGTGMSSQYWGVRHEAVAPPPAPEPSAAERPATDLAPESAHAVTAPAPAPKHRTALDVWWQGVTAVVPWWFALAALAGVAAGRDRRRALAWVFPLAACALLPSLLTYVEPRSLLPLAPLAAVYVAGGCVWAQERMAARWGGGGNAPGGRRLH